MLEYKALTVPSGADADYTEIASTVPVGPFGDD